MKNQFDWQVGEVEEEEEPTRATQSGWMVGSMWFLIAAAVITGFLIVGWRASQVQLARSESRLKEQLQRILDMERRAFLDGDGDLFFSVQSDAPAWMAAQLLPLNQDAVRAGLTVTRVQPQDEFTWANVSWTIDDQTWQKVAFFEWQEETLRHVAIDPAYWGTTLRSRHEWGELVTHQVDETWSRTVALLVDNLVRQICDIGCLTDKRTFTLVLAPDHATTAAPDEIRLPSPRLVGLTEDGKPAPFFWDMVQQRVEAHLRPARIRFAVPPLNVREGFSEVDYQRFAGLFMAMHPEIVIEVINLEELPADLNALAREYDGVAMPPTEELLAAGLVHDLTDFIATDPDFDQADFYEQVWQGAGWRGRTWFMPQAAGMRVIFYDKSAYRLAGLDEPSLRWTWDEMAKDVFSLVAAQPEVTDVVWGYLDIDLDSFYSFAYNWNNRCTEEVTVLCRNPLQPVNIAAGLDWYRQLAGEHGVMPDVTGMTAADRWFFLLNSQTTRRKAAVWVDRPANYELQFLLANLGVVPFPGSDRFDGITPLWVRGSFISQESENPQAVWQWLKYLSYQRPVPRQIPARPSVAESMQFWSVLPRALGNAMRTAFPFARPVTIAEKSQVSWSKLAAVIAGEQSSTDLAQQASGVKWFRR